VPATAAALVLSLATVWGTPARFLVAVAVTHTTAPRAPGTRTSEPPGGAQRATDRVTERRVRGAIRADPFLAVAAPSVKVKSRRGIIRLVGRVRTAKERSSIAFKAGQSAGGGRVDDRVTIDDGLAGAMW
jgi:osmotically-inducible protein OsmY